MSNLKKTILNKLHEDTVNEKTVTPDELRKNTDDLVKAAKDSLGIDDNQAKDYVSGFIGEEEISEINKDVLQNFIDQYGEEKGKQIYYATANKQDRNPETFHMEGSGEDYGDIGMQDLEVGADKYEEYRQLMQQLADEEEGGDVPVKEDVISEATSDFDLTKSDNVSNLLRDVMSVIAKYLGTHSTNNGAVANDNRVIFYNMVNSGEFIKNIQQMLPPSNMHYGTSGNEYLTNNEEAMVKFLNSIGIDTSGKSFRGMPVREGMMNEEGEATNDPVKLKADVEKLMTKLDMSAIAPYLEKIDNPTEQAEVIAQFAEKIGVPKQKLTAVVSQLKTVAENKNPKMTKNALIEAVTGKKPRKVIKTIKVKDIK